MSNKSHIRRLISTTSALLIPVYILSTGTKNYAASVVGPVPETAVIHFVSDPGVRLLRGTTDFGSARQNMRLQKYKDAIGIPGSTLGNFGSLARLSLRNPKDLQIGAILSAGPAAVSSAYTFPCKIYGNTAVGWPQNRGACAQGLWVVPRVQSFGVQPPGSRNANTAAATKNLSSCKKSVDGSRV